MSRMLQNPTKQFQWVTKRRGSSTQHERDIRAARKHCICQTLLAIGGMPEEKARLRRGRAAAAARRRNVAERQDRRLEVRFAERRASW
jgi:hypothetical protein